MPKVSDHADYFSDRVTRTRRFFRPGWRKNAHDKAQLCLVAGGAETCAPDFVIDRRNFPFMAFEFAARGKGTLKLGGRTHELHAGHAFFFDRNLPHIIQTDARDPLTKYFFNFSGPRIRSLLKSLHLSAGSVIRVTNPARITALLEEAIDHALKAKVLSDAAANAAIEHALVLCADGRTTTRGELPAAHETYLRCHDTIVQHYPALNSVADVARRCGVSAAYMTRLFQRFSHEGPYDCLLRLKIGHASVRLRQPDAQVKSVAAELGFKSAAHFSRVFKRVNGIAPQHFRALG